MRQDAASWGLALIRWVPNTLGAVAVIPWHPMRRKDRSCLPPTWTPEVLGKRSGIERFFGRVFCSLRLQRPPVADWWVPTRGYRGRPRCPHLCRVVIVALAHAWQGLACVRKCPQVSRSHPPLDKFRVPPELRHQDLVDCLTSKERSPPSKTIGLWDATNSRSL